MSKEPLVNPEKQARVLRQNNEVKPEEKKAALPENNTPAQAAMVSLQQTVGNRAAQRMLQRSGGEGAFALDDETAGKINSQRGGGQALDTGVQRQMGAAMGHDFSGVRVHTSDDAHELNEKVSAVAFTTGNDIFFRDGAYNPGSSGGQELLAHELTHVVQQSSGGVGGGGDQMTVNAPNDSFEQEADAVAKAAMSAPAPVQRQEEEEELQMKRLQRQEEEEELQMKPLQRQEEEEEVQMKRLQRDAIPEEEELQAKRVQRAAVPEEEELQMKRLQRQEEEEEVQMKRLQRESPEEEEVLA